MSDWHCPDCGGGFPNAPKETGCCPWCDQPIDGEYERKPAKSIVRSESNANGETDSRVRTLGDLL
jgi:hypothetical protein